MQAQPSPNDFPNFGQNGKPKKGSGGQQDKIDSVFLAKQMILGDESNLKQRLLQFKMIKNQNYDKFTNRCLDHLKKSGFEPEAVFDRFVVISQNADNDNTTGAQMGAIFAAFHSFWMTDVPEEPIVKRMFFFIEKVYSPVARKYISCVRKVLSKTGIEDQYQQAALAMTNKLLKIGKGQDCKVLPLIYEFELYGDVPYGRIIDLVLTQPNPSETVYVFQEPNKSVRLSLVKALVNFCSTSEIKSDFTKCEHIIRALEVDPFDFPNYITKLQQRYIAYLFRSYKLFYIELIISHDRDLVILLVEMIIRQNRRKEADYFICKYNLEREFGVDYSEEEKKQLRKIKNVLTDNDGFGPTEEQVLEEEEDSYLKLGDFGLTQKDVIVVTSKNIEQIDYLKEFSGKVGVDQETSGGTHVFDPPRTSLLQFYTGTTIFIFDLLDLGVNEHLSRLLKHIFEHCRLYGQDLQKEVTNLQKDFEVKIEEKIMQEMTRNRLFDSGKIFKKVFPEEKKSSLAYLCQKLWGKKLSKYEQCSGWKRRPLRLAQLHYAALDCVLPLKICQKLETMAKK